MNIGHDGAPVEPIAEKFKLYPLLRLYVIELILLTSQDELSLSINMFKIRISTLKKPRNSTAYEDERHSAEIDMEGYH